MKKLKGPRAFDDVLDLIEKAIKGQQGFVCEGDAVERRATEFYCEKLRLTKRILQACGEAVKVREDGKLAFIYDGHAVARAVFAYLNFLARWEKEERRRAVFEMGEGLIAQGLGRIPALNAGRKAIEANRKGARKLGLRTKP